jgi:CelD/BcsL family acetyltransferase involved in cellulose biosynthesis
VRGAGSRLRLAPVDPAAWDALVAASPDATVFHTAAWARIWEEEWPDARWEALALEDGGGYAAAIGAIVRRRGPVRVVYSMPYATYGGPIVRRGHPDPARARTALLEAWAREARGLLTLRSELAWYRGDRAAFPDALAPVEAFTHVLPLTPDVEALWQGFAPSTRRLVRQGEESGLTMRAIEGEEELRVFHEIATGTVHRRGGRPKPYSLFARIWRTMAPAGLARVHLVQHAGEDIAGSLHFFHEGVATSWLPVSRQERWHLRPNNFLTAHILETLASAGYLEYNFGASPEDAAGLIRFKEGWGARRRPVLLAGTRTAIHRRLRG